MTERNEFDEAIEEFAREHYPHDRTMRAQLIRQAHKHLDPLVTLPEGVKLPVEVLDENCHLTFDDLSHYVAADFINRVAKESE